MYTSKVKSVRARFGLILNIRIMKKVKEMIIEVTNTSCEFSVWIY